MWACDIEALCGDMRGLNSGGAVWGDGGLQLHSRPAHTPRSPDPKVLKQQYARVLQVVKQNYARVLQVVKQPYARVLQVVKQNYARILQVVKQNYAHVLQVVKQQNANPRLLLPMRHPEGGDHHQRHTRHMKIILAVNLFMTAVISAILIYGAIKRNKFMMLPWVVLAFMLAIGILITIIWTAVVFFIDGFVLSGVLTIVIGFIGLAVYVYLWMVVYSYFQLLMEEDGRGPYVKPMSYS
uniref:Uncharacterized protein n=1 Tax=Timema cristinae TaxID=61476 RepID=A0A7R9D1R1_TIMCR|nr:unnamed protein product [Timema cristinae]